MNKLDWQAEWISVRAAQLRPSNQWICFRRNETFDTLPKKAIARIAVDSKYWLWINGQLVVHEGQLKRGPTPTNTYYDELDIAPYLKRGGNQISILLWYWGREGFSHKSSGVPALVFEAQTEDAILKSDCSWKVRQHPAYGESGPPHPNVRLPESNIHFDARLDMPGWNQLDFDDTRWQHATELGRPPVHPWNHLVRRPVPLFRFSSLLPYTNESVFLTEDNWLGHTVIRAKLPGNLSVCPFLKINAPAGLKISIYTDNYRGGSEYNLRVDYITKEGEQEFESPAYLTGHEVFYDFPAGIKLLGLKYRHTQFDTDVIGKFESTDGFLNKLWQKAANTMLLNLRDGIQDPDRERAQWWGDAVILIGQILYACDERGRTAIRKAIYNLVDWQKPNGVLYSPVPAGNWFQELPDQMLAAIGTYGFWYYYRYTGDRETMEHAYPAVKRYLELWKIGADGLVIRRTGGWDWGDWGGNKDMPVLINAWYYMALKSAKNMAVLLGESHDADGYESKIESIQKNFNRVFWAGTEYRSPAYIGETDDRCHALAVVSGLAEEKYFPEIARVFETQLHASPYMEKYVLEALFIMNRPAQAISRMKFRYKRMIDSSFSTLWEWWSFQDKDSAQYGGGSYNHGWSGGPLTLMAEYIAGIKPLSPGFEQFRMSPILGLLEHFNCAVPVSGGLLRLQQDKLVKGYRLTVAVPEGCCGTLELPGCAPVPLEPGSQQFDIGEEDFCKGTTRNFH